MQPSLYRKSELFNVFLNDDKIAEYKLVRSYSELALGKNLDLHGQMKRLDARAPALVPAPRLALTGAATRSRGGR